MQSPDHERLFDAIDTDRSGTIEDSELLIHLLSQGVEEKAITALFRALDVNSDGRISRDEWETGFELYRKALEVRAKREVEETAAQKKRVAEAEEIAARDDFRDLGGGGCTIKLAEHRAITLPQLGAVKAHIGRRCPAEGWTTWQGVPLTAEKVALYDADKYIIRPFTVAKKRAFVEMVARAAQLPKWFVSHWWGEPVRTG